MVNCLVCNASYEETLHILMGPDVPHLLSLSVAAWLHSGAGPRGAAAPPLDHYAFYT